MAAASSMQPSAPPTAAPTIASLSYASNVDVADIYRLSRMSSFVTVERYTKRRIFQAPKRKPNPLVTAFKWWSAWSVPGLGMFSEAYIIFSIGLIKPLQAAMFPECFSTHEACSAEETHAINFVQIAGIIIGMLLFGALGDVIGRCRGSRAVSSIMLSGAVMLVLAPLVRAPRSYLGFFIFAQTFYAFGVGGEYPMASSSAAERSQCDPLLRHKRGQQVLLTFSQQGMGNFVNVGVILLLMAIFSQTGHVLDPEASRRIVMLQFAVAAAVSAFTTVWRYARLKESKVWSAEREDAIDITELVERKKPRHIYRVALRWFAPRLLVTSSAWLASGFAFYGQQLFQSEFMGALYPNATPFERMQWTALNSAVALTGYWAAAAAVDKPWYGRRKMQAFGFFMTFALYLVCGGAFGALTSGASGYRTLQSLYFLSSFFNQFGPNCTTWLVAAEVFPTDVRATFQGVSAAWGKVGAMAADVAFGYVSTRTTFFLSSAFGLLGCLITLLLLPDTTGLSLDELDRMHKYMLLDHFDRYHGEGVNPKNLSLYERWVLGWHRRYDPVLDAAHKEVQSVAASSVCPSMCPTDYRGGRGGPGSPRAAASPRAGAAGSYPPWGAGAWAWSDNGWGGSEGSFRSAAGAALEALGRGVTGVSWAASMRSAAASRRLPPTGEDDNERQQEEEGGGGQSGHIRISRGGSSSAGGGGGRAESLENGGRSGGEGGVDAHQRMEEVD